MAKIATIPILLLAAAVPACGTPDETAAVAPGHKAELQARVPAASCSVGTSTDPLVAPTTRGLLRGKTAGSTVAFLGIPFANPPVGTLRFAPPVAHDCWTGTRAATAYGNACPQRDQDTGKYQGDEDCLTVNVWTPKVDQTAKLPVLFFLYGGGNLTGTSNEVMVSNLYDGQALANREQAVVVTANYRLGALGFFADPSLDAENPKGVSGNQAILDQIAALQWVHDNIVAFGGDPTRVLLFGESAGAIDACILMASPLAAGLFSNVLMESGACGARSQTAQKATSADLAAKLGCTTNVATCLRALTAQQVLAATETFGDVLKDLILFKPDSSLGGAMPWTASVDGYVLQDFPLKVIAAGAHNKVPLVVGSNANEAAIMAPPAPRTCAQYQSDMKTIFGANADQVIKTYPCSVWQPRQAQMDVMTDFLFTCTARHAARAAAASSSVYRYFFTHGASSGLEAFLGAYHSLELAYVFDTFAAKGYTPTAAEQTLASNIEDYWGSFARTLNPATGALSWPAYTTASEQVQHLDLTLSVSTDVRATKCDFWDSLYPAGTGG